MTHLIHQGRFRLRVTADDKGNRFVLKEAVDHSRVDRLRNEADIGARLRDVAGVRPVLGFDERQGLPEVCLAYVEGDTLLQWHQKTERRFDDILSVALSAADALASLHGAGVIHRDISATNLLVDEQGAVQLIDLDLAIPRDQAMAAFSGIDAIVGTLRYMAPEQTGRMNRPVDARSDLYAIGAVLYELFTGEPPFTTDDTLELIHAHLAQTPHPPHQKNPEVPERVSRIVLKLLAKDPQDRYQTAAGLVADLQRCQTSLEKRGHIEQFELGAHDVVEDLCIPDRLYGRDAEVSHILSTFELAASGGRLLLLIQGDPGIGKSSLVREAYPAITRARGLFVEGKFDQYKRFVPYTALTQAFTALTDMILAEPEDALNACRDRMQSALGELGQVVLDVVPALERIIGSQPELTLLDGRAAQSRLRYAFTRWVSSVASLDHPLVLFVDDMQWVDAASLDLLKALLVAPDISGLLVVAAYRDHEVDEAHPFRAAIQELQSSGVRLEPLRLDNLLTGDVAELLADTFATEHHIPKLAQVICDKTLGNPFFTKRFIQNLVDEEHIRFDWQNRQWQWSIDTIVEASLTDNVVDLLVGQFERLPVPVRRLLEVAACIGDRFAPQLLMGLPNVEAEAVREQLELAVTSGFVTERDGGYHFIHDRVQQAAHSMMSSQERAWVHLHIGRFLLGQADDATLDQQVITIVDHLNVASPLLQIEERLELATLNQRAAHMAARASAFVASLKYAEAGLALLPANSWEFHYDLSLDLHEQAALLAPTVGDVECMAYHTRLVIEHARNDIDTARVLKNKIKFLASSGRHHEALDIGFEALEALGLPMPQNPSWEDAVDRIHALDHQLGDAAPMFAAMRSTPTDQDRPFIAALELLESMTHSAYVSRQALGLILIVTYIEQCLLRGLLHRDFPPFYIMWGGVLDRRPRQAKGGA